MGAMRSAARSSAVVVMTTDVVIDECGAVSPEEAVDAILANPSTYEIANVIPDPPRRNGGRPRIYPKWLWVLYADLADVYDSAWAARAVIKYPRNWEHIRRAAAERFPDDPSMHVPTTAPSRSWYIKFRERHVREHIEEYRIAHATAALTAAHETGHRLLAEDLPFSMLDTTRRVQSDGKVIKPLTTAGPSDTKEVTRTDPTTGRTWTEERHVRYDPDVKEHYTGGGTQVHGSKFLIMSVNGPEPHNRVHIIADYIPGVRDEQNSENHLQMKNFRWLAEHAPGIVGATTDTVTRGRDLAEMQRDFGWAPAVKIAAAKVDKKTAERTEKHGYLRTFDFANAGCTADPVEIWHQGGWLTRRVYPIDAPEGVLERLDWKDAYRRPNLDGSFRCYVRYSVPCECGQHARSLTERTDTTAEDEARGFNRSENVRMFPPGSPPYNIVYPERNDAESINRRVDDHLPLRRARSYGWERQLLDLLAHNHVVNSVARFRYGPVGTHRRRSAAQAA
jgi:hypothetical protein